MNLLQALILFAIAGGLFVLYIMHRRGIVKIPALLTEEEGDVHESFRDSSEGIAEFNHDRRFLAQHFQAFADQDDGEEQVRQFCEEFSLEVVSEKGEVRELHLLPLTDDQMADVPANIRYEVSSRRGRKFATRPTAVAAAPGTNGGSHAASENSLDLPKRVPSRAPRKPLAGPDDKEESS